MTGWLPVRQRLNEQLQEELSCPFCEQEVSIAHLYQCHSRKQWRRNLFYQIKQALNDFLTPNHVQHTVINYIKDRQEQPQSYQHFNLFL